jgi:hypothetical protein
MTNSNVYYEVVSDKGIHYETMHQSDAEVFVKRKYQDTGIICKINEVTKEQKEEVI